MTHNNAGRDKGVVIRTEGAYYYALAQDGRYFRLKAGDLPPKAGEIVELPESAVAPRPAQVIRPFRTAFARYAFAALTVAAIGLGVVAAAFFRQPVAYVAIEINPAIELGLNRRGLVVTARGANPEGRAVVEDAVAHDGLAGRSAPDAVASVVKAASELGYLPVDRDNVVQVSVIAPDAFPQVEHGIREMVAALLEARGLSGYLRVRRAGTAALGAARAEGLSVNTYLLKRDLEAQGIEVTDWGRPVRAILGDVGPEKAFGRDDFVGRRNSRGAGSDDQPGLKDNEGRGDPERGNSRGQDREQLRRDEDDEHQRHKPAQAGDSGATRGSQGAAESRGNRGGGADGGGSGNAGEEADRSGRAGNAGEDGNSRGGDSAGEAGDSAEKDDGGKNNGAEPERGADDVQPTQPGIKGPPEADEATGGEARGRGAVKSKDGRRR